MIRSRTSTALVLMLVALSALVAVELSYDVSSRSSANNLQENKAPASGTVSPPFTLPDREELSDTVTRPLFIPSRVPPAEAPVETVVEAPSSTRPTPNRYALSAIVIVDNERIALVTDTTSGTLLRVREGERLSGWQVEEILADSAVLTSGDSREELSLRSFGPPLPAPAQAPTRRHPRFKRPDDANIGNGLRNSSAPTRRARQAPRQENNQTSSD